MNITDQQRRAWAQGQELCGYVSRSHVAEPIGHYVSCDDAVCIECDKNPAVTFHEWEENLVIWPDSESDTPTHCGECGAMIAHSLTPYGVDYIREVVDQNIALGDSNRPASAQWVDYYLDPLYGYGDDDTEDDE